MASEWAKKRTPRDSSEVVMWMRCVFWKMLQIKSLQADRAGFGYFVVMSHIKQWVGHRVIMTEVWHSWHQTCRINKSLYILNICTIFLNLLSQNQWIYQEDVWTAWLLWKTHISHGTAIQSAILMLKLLVVTWGLAHARPFRSFKNQKIWRLNKNIVLHAIKEHNNFGDNDQKCLI
jgi:hypothetical protein